MLALLIRLSLLYLLCNAQDPIKTAEEATVSADGETIVPLQVILHDEQRDPAKKLQTDGTREKVILTRTDRLSMKDTQQTTTTTKTVVKESQTESPRTVLTQTDDPQKTTQQQTRDKSSDPIQKKKEFTREVLTWSKEPHERFEDMIRKLEKNTIKKSESATMISGHALDSNRILTQGSDPKGALPVTIKKEIQNPVELDSSKQQHDVTIAADGTVSTDDSNNKPPLPPRNEYMDSSGNLHDLPVLLRTLTKESRTVDPKLIYGPDYKKEEKKQSDSTIKPLQSDPVTGSKTGSATANQKNPNNNKDNILELLHQVDPATKRKVLYMEPFSIDDMVMYQSSNDTE